MTPFQEFRLWARRAPVGERAGTGVAGVLVVALLAWLLVPASTHSSKVSTGGTSATSRQGAASGATGDNASGAGAPLQSTSGGGGVGGVGGDGGAATTGGTASGTEGTGGCVSPPGSAQGVSDSELEIAVTLVNVIGPAANSLFGIPTPQEQKTAFEAVIDSLNQEGGIACRQIVAQFIEANPADQSGLQKLCLDIAQSGVFAVVDPGAYAVVGPLCFAQNHLPYFGGYLITQKQENQGYPYLFDLGQFDRLFRDTVFALRDRGFFDPASGFNKLGIIYRDCYPELIEQTIAALHQSGVQDSQISKYNVTCPTAFASPADIQAAVLQFIRDHVTHMTEVADVGDLQNFTTIAQLQGFKPKWGLGDDQVIGTAYGNQPPDANNLSNAVIITESRNGEERTDGMTPTAGTVQCDAYYTAHALPPTYQQPPAMGNFCDQIWMLKAAIENAPAFSVDALGDGLHNAGSIDFSYPQGPNDFSGTGVTSAGQFWRTAQFFTDCRCWKLIESDFHPSYG